MQRKQINPQPQQTYIHTTHILVIYLTSLMCQTHACWTFKLEICRIRDFFHPDVSQQEKQKQIEAIAFGQPLSAFESFMEN